MFPKLQKGFIALFTVIIVSFTLLLLAITTNFSSLTGRVNIYDSENKERSAEVAYACIEQARLILAINPTFSGSDDVSVGDDTCHYDVSSDEIVANSEVNNANTFFWAEVDVNEPNIPITEFKECEDLSPCP